MKKLLLFSCLTLALGLSSCESSDEGVMSIELVCPKALTVTTELATASFKWDAVAKAEGYAYALDNSTEYTTIDASMTTLKLTQLSRGTHTFRIHAVGDQGHTTDSAERTIDFDIDPSLPAPAPAFKMSEDLTSAIFTWQAVKGAAGYDYKFDGDSDWTHVGPEVLSITKDGLSANQNYVFTIKAIGTPPDSETSEEFELPFRMINTSKGGWIRFSDGNLIELEKSNEELYTSTIECKSSDEFSVLIDGEEYGFASYSGNGGVGKVNNANACVPTAGVNFYVRESIGQMATKDDNLNKFWINVADATCKVKVRIDLSYEDKIPRYYLQLVEEADPSVLLAQYFDLMSYGGNWLDGKNGRKGSDTNATSIDGTAPAVPATVSAATLGVTIASNTTAKPQYIANRGLSGWGIENCFEFAGLLRLSSPGFGVLTTPKMTGMTSTGTITLTFDAVAFGGTTDLITVKVLNAGTISSANVKIQGAASATDITPESGNTSFIITKEHCPKYANTEAKAYSNFTVVIENATADTQICWDTTAITTLSNARLCLDNIIVKKN